MLSISYASWPYLRPRPLCSDAEDDPGPTAPLRPDAEADAWAAAVLYASASTADAPQEAPDASDRVERIGETAYPSPYFTDGSNVYYESTLLSIKNNGH